MHLDSKVRMYHNHNSKVRMYLDSTIRMYHDSTKVRMYLESKRVAASTAWKQPNLTARSRMLVLVFRSRTLSKVFSATW